MIRQIENAIIENRLAHAYILEGRDRDARASFEEEFVRMTGASLIDIHRMEKTGKREYKVEDASRFMEAISMRPYGKLIVGIIDDADLLSETVQNKLLKTLEEPAPDTVLLLFCVNRDSLIQTVRSRCVMARLESSDGVSGSSQGAFGTAGRVASDEEAGKAPDDIEEGVNMFLEKAVFCDFRAFADKKMDSPETALSMLDRLEKRFGEMMLSDCANGGDGMRYSEDIDKIEQAVSDISRGMNPKKAVKRLFIELK